MIERKPLRGEQEIMDNSLVPIENKNKGQQYIISITLPEFTCKCPITGYPDFAVIHLKYIPLDTIVELKSLKLYINSFRDHYMFHEEVPNRILKDLVELTSPQWMQIIGDFNERGNVKTVIKCEYNSETGYVLSNKEIS